MNSLARSMPRIGMWAIADQFLFTGTNFIVAFAIGRFGSARELGTYSLCFSILMILICIQRAVIVYPFIIVRESIPLLDQARLRGTLLVMTLVAGVFLGLLALFPLPNVPRTLSVALLFALPAGLLRDFCRGIATAEFKVRHAFLLDAAVAILKFILLWQLIRNAHLTTTWVFVGCAIIWTVVSLIGIRIRLADFSWEPSLFSKHYAMLLPHGRWIGLSQLVSTFQAFLMPWIIASLFSLEMAGVYAACWTVVQMVSPVVEAVGNVFAPQLAKNAATGDWNAMRKQVYSTTGLFAVFMVSLLIVVLLGGSRILQVLYGTPYAQYTTILSFLTLATCFINMGIPVSKVLNQWGAAHSNFWISLVGLTLSSVLAVPMTRMLGVEGAAVALICGGGVCNRHALGAF